MSMPGAPDQPGPAPDRPRLELVCFGPPTARLAGREAPADVLWRKNLALLIYLALAPQYARSRNQILRVLWPDKDESRGRHSLNEALHRLRASLGPSRLRSHGESIALDPQDLAVDAVAFAALVGANPSEALPLLLRGDFLDGFIISDAPEFDDWAAAERARFRRIAAAALVSHGEKLLGSASFAGARDAARRALALEPYSEPAVSLEIRAAALAGDQAGALKAYHAFSTALEQIGEQPSRELAALAGRIRSHRWRRSEEVGLDEPPLVGRAAALGEVARVLKEGLAHGPRTLAICGDPGTGKTRLLNHCLERLALEGAVIVAARPLDGDQDTPWSTLRTLMRAGLLAAPGLPAADPHGLAVLAALVPELAGRVEPRQPQDRAQVAGALASLLGAVADEAPLALALDQAQSCDGATLGALHAALEQVPGLPIVLILASAPGPEGAPAELLQLQRDIGRGIAGAVVQLEPLTLEDIGELVAVLAPWCSAAPERGRLARRIAFETRGNPFLAVTLLRGLQDLSLLRQEALAWPPPQATLESPLPLVVPDLLRRTILGRLAQLDRESKAVLDAASVGGPALDTELVGALTGLTGAMLDERLALLERQRFLAFDNGRYLFAAPLIERVVRAEALTPGQVSGLRARAIEALGPRQDLESRALRVELLARTAPGIPAFEEAVAVARAAVAARSERFVRRALQAAERAVASEPAVDRSELDRLRAQLAP